jgi:energy-coupling factor transporter ATP-binding protein EcfA2
MIKSFQFTTGFPTAYPHLKDRKFVFNDKLNVLFGNVGSCKSTMLKTMAGYCGITNGGWSSISEPAQLAYNEAKHFPFCYRNLCPGRVDAVVEWDGTPSFFNDSEAMGKHDNTWFFSNASKSADGITSDAEQLEILASKPSSGQYRIHKINKIMKVIQEPPILTVVPPYIQNRELAQLEVNYIKTLSRDGKVTLLLDEPEKALSIPKQIELFDVLVKLAEHFQVIVATHSPFILEYKKANMVDVTPGYISECKKLIKNLSKGK